MSIPKKRLNMVGKSGISKSKWIAEMIREKTATRWPEDVIEMAGTWNDFPDVDEIRAEMGADVERAPI